MNNKERTEALKELCDKYGLYPMVSLTTYSKTPYCSWGDDENQKSEVSAFGSKFEWINKANETKRAVVTGHSLITGELSGVMVLDIDNKKGENGSAALKALCDDLSLDYEELFNTLVVKTMSGGYHLYFKYRQGLKNKAKYIEGIDIRTDGGLIVLPYSKVRVDGKNGEYNVFNDSEIKDMPGELFNFFRDKCIVATPGVTKAALKRKREIPTSYDDLKSKKLSDGEGRNQDLISYLGQMIQVPFFRNKDRLREVAFAFTNTYHNPPLEERELESVVQSALNYSYPPYCDEKGNVDCWELVQKVLKETPCYTKGNLWYIYNNKGYYEYRELRRVQKMYFDYAINSKDKTSIKSKNFADLLMLTSEDGCEVYHEKRYISCLNGIIDTETWKLLPHDEKYKVEVQFKGNFINEWKEKFNNSEFKKFLENILDLGSIRTLQEAWGLMLSPHAKEVQNCFIYKGEGSNGKSTAFDIQEALIGTNDKICGIGLGDFGEDFVISMAEGKHVNIVRDDELSGKTVHKFFKSMVCGEPVTVNRKRKDLVRLAFNMTMFFGLNRLPSAADKSTGFFRRPIIIPFNQSFGTEEEVKKGIRKKLKDSGLADRIIDNELDIVFMWALEGLRRVKDNNWKVTKSKAAEAEMEEYREEVDSAYAFFKLNLEIEPNNFTSSKDLYVKYNEWCLSEQITPMNTRQFSLQLSSFGGIKGHNSTKTARGFKNIKFKDMVEVDSTEAQRIFK